MRGALVASNGPVSGQEIALKEGETIIGCSPSSAISVPHISISSEHCVVRCSAAGVEILDLQSRNGTFVNGLRIQQRALEHGDKITIGEIVFQFRASYESTSSASLASRTADIVRSSIPRAPDAPLAGQTATLLRLSEISRSLQGLYLDRDGRGRSTLERHLFELVFELIPSRRGAIVVVEGDGPQQFAGYDGEAADSRATVPECVLESVLQSHATRTGVVDGCTWLASPLAVSGRVLGLLYVGSGLVPREYAEDDEHMITVLCELLGLALENARDLHSLHIENARLRAGSGAENLMIGESPGMTTLFGRIAKVARGNSTVLIRGESGTGKELVAQSIHRNSPRAARPFVTINCAAIAESLLESEFFGHEKGSFTGAYAQRKGSWNLPTGGPFSWTKSENSRLHCRPSSCACSRSTNSTAWGEPTRFEWTFA